MGARRSAQVRIPSGVPRLFEPREPKASARGLTFPHGEDRIQVDLTEVVQIRVGRDFLVVPTQTGKRTRDINRLQEKQAWNLAPM